VPSLLPKNQWQSDSDYKKETAPVIVVNLIDLLRKQEPLIRLVERLGLDEENSLVTQTHYPISIVNTLSI